MNLTEMMNEMRHELQEETGAIYSGADLTRAIQKSVGLMSRLIPKRNIVEATLTRSFADAALTILSNTGTTTYKPVKIGSFSIDGETLNTDYTLNHLTGVVTEISANMIDGAYICDYSLDPKIFDLSTLLTTDYIKIERVEYPAGDSPRTNVPFDLVGCYLIFGEDITLTTNQQIRITYLEPWTAPTTGADGNYPEHLDTAIIVGSCGQALIFKAELYVQSAVSALSALTAPTLHVYTEIGAPSLPTAPTAPTAPTLSFSTAEGTAASGAAALVTALAYLTTGAPYILTINDAERVGEKYGSYGSVGVAAGSAYGGLATAYNAVQLAAVAKYSHEVASFVGEVNQYASEVSGTVGKYREQVGGQNIAVAANMAMIQKYAAQAGEQAMKAENFLSIAGRYLASGQAKINEMLIMLGLKPEFHMYKSSSEQFS